MLPASVSTIDSITTLPVSFRTAITTASLCTSMPIYLISRLMQLPPWGKDHSRQRSLSLKVKCHASTHLPIFSSDSCPTSLPYTHPAGPLSHNALTAKKANKRRRVENPLSCRNHCRFDSVAKGSECPNHSCSADALCLFTYRRAAFLIANAVVQNDPDQVTEAVGNDPDRFIMSETWHETTADDVEDTSFVFDSSIGSLIDFR